MDDHTNYERFPGLATLESISISLEIARRYHARAAIFHAHLTNLQTSGYADEDGWVAVTSAEIEQDTVLSRFEQITARRRLVNAGLLEERLQGLPAQLSFRPIPVDAPRLPIERRTKHPRRPAMPRRPSPEMEGFIAQHGARCTYCRRVGTHLVDPDGSSWHREHMVPRSRGGGDGENLTLSCRSCNSSKGTRTAEEFLAALAAD